MSNLRDSVAKQVVAAALAANVDFGSRVTETTVSVTATSTTTLNTSLGNVWEISLATNINTLAFTNVPTAGKTYSMTLKLKQDATGNRSVTWPASIKWPAGTAPTLTATANKYDVIVLFTSDGGSTWTGSIGSQNY